MVEIYPHHLDISLTEEIVQFASFVNIFKKLKDESYEIISTELFLHSYAFFISYAFIASEVCQMHSLMSKLLCGFISHFNGFKLQRRTVIFKNETYEKSVAYNHITRKTDQFDCNEC